MDLGRTKHEYGNDIRLSDFLKRVSEAIRTVYAIKRVKRREKEIWPTALHFSEVIMDTAAHVAL